MFVYEPPAQFRSNRNYVHSTDLYDALVGGAAEAGLPVNGPFDLRIRRAVRNRPRYRYFSGAPADGAPVATFPFHANGTACVVQVEEGLEAVTDRKPYDERPAARAAHIDGLNAVLDGETGMRPIEAVTALGVYLHKSALPPPAGRRWMLAQLKARRPLVESETRRLALEIDKQIGKTMTRTQMTGEDGPLGTMVFILADEVKA
jgi:hypothetical protein